jgi:hypothetical protein
MNQWQSQEMKSWGCKSPSHHSVVFRSQNKTIIVGFWLFWYKVQPLIVLLILDFFLKITLQANFPICNISRYGIIVLLQN